MLSLGLKFDIGGPNKNIQEFVMKNNRYTDSDIEKGFKQGVSACITALAGEENYSIPERFAKAIDELRNDSSIIITTADKGGGVVIMNYEDYVEKMKTLLLDPNTYRSEKTGTCKIRSDKFNKQARKLLRQSEQGKKMQYLLEEKPTSPKMRGQPKTHKQGIPMRPITSGIGSAPHRLAKHLAKPLTQCLGTISPTHLKNSADLLEKLKAGNHNQQKMVSFDVKALFTNVPLDGAMEALSQALDISGDLELPVPKEDYIRLVRLCLEFGCLDFEGDEYTQINGLAMGSPLSAVLASLYMETLEKEHYLPILGDDVTMYRYVDDMILFLPNDTNTDDLLRRFNEVEPAIQFTYEVEKDGTLPFLDVVIRKSEHELKFSVYRKPTNKDDFIHYFSAHSMRTKRGIVIGFYLRALRICSKEYLREELAYIMRAFRRLKFPEGLLINLKNTAEKIHARSRLTTPIATTPTTTAARTTPTPIQTPTPIPTQAPTSTTTSTATPTSNERKTTYLVAPHTQHTDLIGKKLISGIKVVSTAGRKIGTMVKRKKDKVEDSDSVVYKIPCGKCDKSYFGETGRGLKTRVREHRNDLRNHRTSKAIVMHADQDGHLPKWDEAVVMHTNLKKVQRWLIESAYINTEKVTNISSGFFKLHPCIAQLIKNEANNNRKP